MRRRIFAISEVWRRGWESFRSVREFAGFRCFRANFQAAKTMSFSSVIVRFRLFAGRMTFLPIICHAKCRTRLRTGTPYRPRVVNISASNWSRKTRYADSRRYVA